MISMLAEASLLIAEIGAEVEPLCVNMTNVHGEKNHSLPISIVIRKPSLVIMVLVIMLLVITLTPLIRVDHLLATIIKMLMMSGLAEVNFVTLNLIIRLEAEVECLLYVNVFHTITDHILSHLPLIMNIL